MIILTACANQVHLYTQTETLTLDSGRHHAHVVFLVQPFAATHKLKIAEENGYEVVYVDGRLAYGVVGGPPKSELKSVTVTVDNRPWPFPKRLYRDCFGEDFLPHYLKRLRGTLSKDGKRIQIDMGGADGAASYAMRWRMILNRRADRWHIVDDEDRWKHDIHINWCQLSRF